MTTGSELRDQGAAQAFAAEHHGQWKAVAERVLATFANSGVPFNADDVRVHAGSPSRPNAMGALFLKAVRSGQIVRVGERGMIRSEAHARRTPLYRGE